MSYIALTLGFTALFAVLSFHKEYKTTWSILCAFVFVLFGVINYNTLPVLQWWGFEGVWIEAFIVSLAGAGLHFAFCADDSDYEIKYAWRFIPTGITVLAFFIAGFQSWEMFHADEYYKRLKVETVPDSVFNADVHPIPVSKMISVDGKLARKVAEDKLGEDLGLGSRVEVGNMTIQNITGEFTINNGKKLVFNNDLIWVAPLEYRSFWKWFRNGHTPGYIIVDATDATRRWLVTEVNGQKLRIQYLESGRFGDDIERHIKGNGYASKGLNDHCFEIDGNGNPYWVLSSYDQKIGFGGEESEGPITVDAQTGELKAYSIEDAPAWIDRIQPQSFIEDQIRCWGEYKDGWWNAVWAQIGVQEPTPGTTLVYSEGRSFWYTGIQSAGADNGTNGFMLVDTRTKAAKFYRVIGINETEAMRIADVAMTGEWEKELARIERGELPADDFRRKIEAYTREITSELLSCDKLFARRDSGCKCPKCGAGTMQFYGKVVRCDNAECGLPVFRLKANRTLSDDEIKNLLTDGHTKLLKGFKSKQGKSFDAVVAFDGDYNTVFVFPERKSKATSAKRRK